MQMFLPSQIQPEIDSDQSQLEPKSMHVKSAVIVLNAI